MSGLQNNPQNNPCPHPADFSCAWAGEFAESGGAARDVDDAATCARRDINHNASQDFAGHLDDFRIYGMALAAGEALGLVSPVSTVSRQYVWGLYIDELVQQKNLIGGPSGGAAGQEAGGHYLMSDLLYRAAALVTPDSGETSGVRILENYDFDAYGNTLVFFQWLGGEHSAVYGKDMDSEFHFKPNIFWQFMRPVDGDCP